MIYLAYGSNLNCGHLRDWVSRSGIDPDAVSNPRRAILEGFRFRTNYLRTGLAGAANIERCPRGRVEGVVYDLTGAALLALRRKEGCPLRYEEIVVPVRLVGTNRLVSATTYVVTAEFRLPWDMPVSAEYRKLILDGAAQHNLSPVYRRRLTRLLKIAPQMAPSCERSRECG